MGIKKQKKNRQKPKEERIDMVEHAPIPTSWDKRISKIRNEIESNSKTKKRTSHEIELNHVERNPDTLTKEKIFQTINNLGQKE